MALLSPIPYAPKVPEYAKAGAVSWRPRNLVHEPLGGHFIFEMLR